ncbi:MAG: zinc-binding dehydrogenase [Bacteroidetes bacterium]|nr:zinc-binding dehydrogenase [Bacteroidota bacterium]
MKALTVKEAGAPETLQVVEIETSNPNNNEIVITQTYAGINYGDAIRRKRGLFTLNSHGYYVPGFEGVGIVTSVGNEVKDFRVGDRVGYLNAAASGYAEEVCIAEDYVFSVPNNIPDQDAAALTCVGATAWHLLNQSLAQKSDWVLVHGATGGVGLILVQIALAKGVKVIAVVGNENKKEFIPQHNNVAVVVRGESDISDRVLEITNGQGVKVIFDCVGQAVLGANLKCIKKGGTIMYFGSTSGHPEFPGMPILMNSLTIRGFNIFNLLTDVESWRKDLESFYEFVSANHIKVHISSVFRLEDTYKAHQLLEDRNSIGKMLIKF